jgi:hypothetical protein
MDSFPTSTYFARETAEPSQAAGRNATQLEANPFAVSPHTAALVAAQVTLAPLVMVWDYKVADARAYTGWLTTKDILVKSARLEQDRKLCGVRYGGTYRITGRADEANSDTGDGVWFRTHWGFTDEASMQAMHALCSGNYQTATIAQIDLMEFVTGIKAHVATGGDAHFCQQVLVASSVAAE